RCFFPTRNNWLSTVTVPATLTRRMKVTRPADSGSRSVGTTKLAGSFCSRRPRRCCAGVKPPSRGWACWGLTASCRPASSPPRAPPPPPPPLQQRPLAPAVEFLHAAVELRLPFGDEPRADAEAEAEPDHPRQGARRGSPTCQLAGVVELDLLRSAQVLPALP